MPIVSQIAPDVGFVSQAQHLVEANAYSAAIGLEGLAYEIKLFKAGEVDATSITSLAAFEAAECDYTGYASVNLEDLAPEPFEDENDGSYLVTIPSQQFNHGAVGTANDVGGWFLVSETGVVLCGNFETPITMEGPTDSIVLTITRRFGP